MATTKYKLPRGLKQDIISNISSLNEYEIVFATDTEQIGVVSIVGGNKQIIWYQDADRLIEVIDLAGG